MTSIILALTFSLNASSSEKHNPYSQYGMAYESYATQYQTLKANACDDPNWDGDCVCGRQKEKIEWVKNNGQSLNEFNWSKIQSKQLIMIGDSHGLSNPDSILTLIKLSRSNSGKQCVLFEMSADWSSHRFLKLMKEKTGNAETDKLRRYYGKIANGAVAEGFKIYMVDDPRSWSEEGSVTDYERDVYMADTIKTLFDNRKCDQAIQIVGKAHVAGLILPWRLTQNRISFMKLNPIQAPAGGRNGPTEEWNGLCETQTFSPNRAIIFENSGIKDDWVIPSFDQTQNAIRFGDFDYSILFPDTRFEQNLTSQRVRRHTTKATGAVK